MLIFQTNRFFFLVLQIDSIKYNQDNECQTLLTLNICQRNYRCRNNRIGPNIYNLDLNVALIHDQELARTLAENLGRHLPSGCTMRVSSFSPCLFPIQSLPVTVSVPSSEILPCLRQDNSPVHLISSLATVALLGPVLVSWLCPPSSSHLCFCPLPSLSSVVKYSGKLFGFVLKYVTKP